MNTNSPQPAASRTSRRPRRRAPAQNQNKPRTGAVSAAADNAAPAPAAAATKAPEISQVDVAAIRSPTASKATGGTEATVSAQERTPGAAKKRPRRGGRRQRSPASPGTASAKTEATPPKPPARSDGPAAATARLATEQGAAKAPSRGRRRRKKTTRPPSEPAPPANKSEKYEPSPPPPPADQRDTDRDDGAPRQPSPTGADFDQFDVERANLTKAGSRTMVINVSGEDECRIAILNEGRLEELFIERGSSQSLVGNIYKGRVTNVEPSIQAAFIEFGLPKHGFLHVSDLQPQYFPNHKGGPEEVGRKIPRHQRPPIQKCFRRGQEVLVQVTKQGVGTKGPTLTTYLSIPGQFLVMLPGMARHGVSRKIEDDEDRRRMRDLLGELALPSGVGVIIRTAGLDKNKRELQRDLNYMSRLWKTVMERIRELPAPAEVYRESDLITRTLRDIYTSDFTRIIVDDVEAARRVRAFLELASPRSKPNIEVYSQREPLFHRLGVEDEIERINARHVPLPSGGSLVIDSTEALVAIDVNSGKFRQLDDPEETALQINLEAAEEIARQLRLRDLGGLIICDFIDMRHDRNNRKVERALRDALKKHKERVRLLRMSAFGLIEITRQRQGPSIKQNTYLDCPHCHGSGVVKTPESVILEVMRTIQLATHREPVRRVVVTVAGEVANQILNRKRSQLHRIESETGKVIVVQGDPHFTADQIECLGEDDRGQIVQIRGREPARSRFPGPNVAPQPAGGADSRAN
jgi:ribonuclease E